MRTRSWIRASVAACCVLGTGGPCLGNSVSAPGYIVETYAALDKPEELAFGAAGELYVGCNGDTPNGLARIYQVAPGGGGWVYYGNDEILDPDAVAFDAAGEITGQPGTVLVGGSPGFIKAIWPDQTVHPVVEGGVLSNPGELLFDPDGQRLLIRDSGRREVQMIRYAAPGLVEVLIDNLPASPAAIAMDATGRIFVGLAGGTIQVYAADGAPLEPDFAQVPDTKDAYGLAVGPGGSVWGSDLYCVADGELWRIDATSGNAVTMGTGFDNPSYDIAFGPDGALYVSQKYGDLLRVQPIPEPLTALGLILAAGGLGAYLRRR